MIVLCDEDIGTAVPDSLRSVGYLIMSMAHRGWLGIDDEKWLRTAGRKGWLVFSANKKMLLVPHERQAIVDARVGIVFLTSGEERIDRVLWLLLHRWHWLEDWDRSEQRPFARFLTPDGRRLVQFKHYGL